MSHTRIDGLLEDNGMCTVGGLAGTRPYVFTRENNDLVSADEGVQRCMIQNSLPHLNVDPYNQEYRRPTYLNSMQFRHMIRNNRIVGTPSTFGVVTLGNIINRQLGVIQKMPKAGRLRTDMPGRWEVTVGSRVFNRLNRLTGCFVHTYGSYVAAPSPLGTFAVEGETQADADKHAPMMYSPATNDQIARPYLDQELDRSAVTVIVQEYAADAVSLKNFIQNCNLEEFALVLDQILLIQQIMWQEARVTHNDMHTDNIVVQKQTHIINYRGISRAYPMRIRIIDYGAAQYWSRARDGVRYVLNTLPPQWGIQYANSDVNPQQEFDILMTLSAISSLLRRLTGTFEAMQLVKNCARIVYERWNENSGRGTATVFPRGVIEHDEPLFARWAVIENIIDTNSSLINPTDYYRLLHAQIKSVVPNLTSFRVDHYPYNRQIVDLFGSVYNPRTIVMDERENIIGRTIATHMGSEYPAFRITDSQAIFAEAKTTSMQMIRLLYKDALLLQGIPRENLDQFYNNAKSFATICDKLMIHLDVLYSIFHVVVLNNENRERIAEIFLNARNIITAYGNNINRYVNAVLNYTYHGDIGNVPGVSQAALVERYTSLYPQNSSKILYLLACDYTIEAVTLVQINEVQDELIRSGRAMRDEPDIMSVEGVRPVRAPTAVPTARAPTAVPTARAPTAVPTAVPTARVPTARVPAPKRPIIIPSRVEAEKPNLVTPKVRIGKRQ